MYCANATVVTITSNTYSFPVSFYTEFCMHLGDILDHQGEISLSEVALKWIDKNHLPFVTFSTCRV